MDLISFLPFGQFYSRGNLNYSSDVDWLMLPLFTTVGSIPGGILYNSMKGTNIIKSLPYTPEYKPYNFFLLLPIVATIVTIYFEFDKFLKISIILASIIAYKFFSISVDCKNITMNFDYIKYLLKYSIICYGLGDSINFITSIPPFKLISFILDIIPYVRDILFISGLLSTMLMFNFMHINDIKLYCKIKDDPEPGNILEIIKNFFDFNKTKLRLYFTVSIIVLIFNLIFG